MYAKIYKVLGLIKYMGGGKCVIMVDLVYEIAILVMDLCDLQNL